VDGAPLWAIVLAGVLAFAGDLAHAGLWLIVRARGSRPPRHPERRATTLNYAATVAAVFVAALLTRSWLLVALLIVPGLVALALFAHAAAQVVRSRH
jgi:hypothetical protein